MRVDIKFVRASETPDKIKMIKLMRGESDLGLREAKDIVEATTLTVDQAFTVSVGNMDEIRVINEAIKQFGFSITNYVDLEKIFGDIETEFKQFIKRCVELEKMSLASDLCGLFAKHYYG